MRLSGAKPWERNDPILHIELRRWANLMVICPLSADMLAKIVCGGCEWAISECGKGMGYDGVEFARGRRRARVGDCSCGGNEYGCGDSPLRRGRLGFWKRSGGLLVVGREEREGQSGGMVWGFEAAENGWWSNETLERGCGGDRREAGACWR